jgi:hypothetical protein
MRTQEILDERLVNLVSNQPVRHHSVAKVRQRTRVGRHVSFRVPATFQRRPKRINI